MTYETKNNYMSRNTCESEQQLLMSKNFGRKRERERDFKELKGRLLGQILLLGNLQDVIT